MKDTTLSLLLRDRKVNPPWCDYVPSSFLKNFGVFPPKNPLQKSNYKCLLWPNVCATFFFLLFMVVRAFLDTWLIS